MRSHKSSVVSALPVERALGRVVGKAKGYKLTREVSGILSYQFRLLHSKINSVFLDYGWSKYVFSTNHPPAPGPKFVPFPTTPAPRDEVALKQFASTVQCLVFVTHCSFNFIHLLCAMLTTSPEAGTMLALQDQKHHCTILHRKCWLATTCPSLQTYLFFLPEECDQVSSDYTIQVTSCSKHQHRPWERGKSSNCKWLVGCHLLLPSPVWTQENLCAASMPPASAAVLCFSYYNELLLPCLRLCLVNTVPWCALISWK